MSDEKKKEEETKAPDLDLSSVSNLKAEEQLNPASKKAVENTAPKLKKKAGSKFDFRTPELIPLPSGCRLYETITDDKDISDGFISMLPMTLKEEEILSTSNLLKQGVATRMVLDNCINSDIEAKDLLLFDTNFLLFYLRKISYGDEMTFKLQCDSCGKKFEHTINISDLTFEELPEDIEEPIEVKLEASKYTVQVILPRSFHSEEIYKKNQNRKKNSSSTDSTYLENLLVTTIAIYDEDGKELPKKDWEAFFEALPGRDRAMLTEKTKFSTGIDELEGIQCPYCEAIEDKSIPIGAEFFRF